MTRSTRPRFQFRPTLDHLDRRDVPSGLTFDPVPFVPCDSGMATPSNITIPSETAWPSPLVISGPSSPI